jgi:hypothetical protein
MRMRKRLMRRLRLMMMCLTVVGAVVEVHHVVAAAPESAAVVVAVAAVMERHTSSSLERAWDSLSCHTLVHTLAFAESLVDSWRRAAAAVVVCSKVRRAWMKGNS